MKNIRFFFSENFQILVAKFSIYLNRRVFVISDILMQKKQNLSSVYSLYLDLYLNLNLKNRNIHYIASGEISVFPK